MSEANNPSPGEVTQMVQNARAALDRWYSGQTGDPSEVVMYAENLLGTLRAIDASRSHTREGQRA